jgi:hypothetical protein
LSAVFDRLIKTHISLRLGVGISLGSLWDLSGSSLGALWELVAVADILLAVLVVRPVHWLKRNKFWGIG